MFRWCAYCQSLIGEKAPFEDFRISHGVCASCFAGADKDGSMPIKGLELYGRLFAAAKSGDQSKCRTLADEALSQGWRPSDAAIGLLQPGLYQIGCLWAKGDASVADEHRFTSWCEHVLTILEERAPAALQPPRVLICAVEGEAHTIGARIAALYLRDRGVTARAVLGGLPDDEILELCARERPEVLGLSASQEYGLEHVRAISNRARRLAHPPRVVVGGLASRLPAAAVFDRALTTADLGSSLSRQIPSQAPSR